VDTAKITHISLCTGYGGIDLGLRRVLPSLRTIAYSEIEVFAVENLLARMEAGQLEAAPIWSDLKSFPWESFRGVVDILSGGYPCQPFSAAGLRKGTEDPRHLWPFIASGIQVVRPRLCFFENVEGHISLGLREVIADLESLGYETTWGIFSAAEVGAPHQRKRVFLLANSMCERGQFPIKREQPAEQMLRSESEAWRAWRSWAVKPTVCGGNNGSANRVDRLRLLGNGVVPATAELAFKTLLNELHKDRSTTNA
jgi:site-specific DNA-cytosine methylase